MDGICALMILKCLGHVGDFISGLQFFYELTSQKEEQLQDGGFASLVLELLGDSSLRISLQKTFCNTVSAQAPSVHVNCRWVCI